MKLLMIVMLLVSCSMLELPKQPKPPPPPPVKSAVEIQQDKEIQCLNTLIDKFFFNGKRNFVLEDLTKSCMKIYNPDECN